MIASSSARFLAYFFTIRRRFWSRLMTAVLAMESSVLERELERGEQCPGFGVGPRRRRDRDVHATERVDLVVLDLRENDLLLDAEVVIPASVEGTPRHAAEVPHARQRDRDQPVEEFVHALLAQRDHAADRVAGADLPDRDRLLGLGDHRLLPRELLHVAHRVLEDLLVGDGFADAHVQHDLLDPGDFHRGLVAELLDQRRHDFLLVDFLEARHGQTPSISPFDLKKRTLRPSLSVRKPMRSGFWVTGFQIATFDTWIGISLATIPPGWLRIGFGLVCRLAWFTPETTR